MTKNQVIKDYHIDSILESLSKEHKPHSTIYFTVSNALKKMNQEDIKALYLMVVTSQEYYITIINSKRS